MVDVFLDIMLGPLRVISKFYMEYQVIFNPIIVGLAVWQLFINKRKQQKSEVNG